MSLSSRLASKKRGKKVLFLPGQMPFLLVAEVLVALATDTIGVTLLTAVPWVPGYIHIPHSAASKVKCLRLVPSFSWEGEYKKGGVTI